MKRIYRKILCLLPVLLIMSGCHFSGQQQKELPVIDVSQSYPVKEIELSEIADIHYVKLKIDEEYVLDQAPSQVTPNYIIITDKRKGNIIFYDRQGDPVNIIPMKGSGPNEFSWISNTLYDEGRDELFVLGDEGKFKVYNKEGVFLRDLKIEDKYLELHDFNNQWILSHIYKGEDHSAFCLINKENGNIEKEISFPYEKRLEPRAVIKRGNMSGGIGTEKFYAVKHPDGFLLNEYSIDTVFILTPELVLIPKLTRIPESQQMDPFTYLNSMIETKDYYFFSHVKLEFDFEKRIRPPLTHIGMDKKSGELFTQQVKFKDFKNREILLGPSTIEISNDPLMGIISLSAGELLEAYEQNLLNGELKEIASKLDMEDNDVIMFVHFK